MQGVVIKSTGSWYTVLTDAQTIIECRIKGVFRIKGITTTNPIAVGDNVKFEMENDGRGVIHEIADRKNYIIRKSATSSHHPAIFRCRGRGRAIPYKLKTPRHTARKCVMTRRSQRESLQIALHLLTKLYLGS